MIETLIALVLGNPMIIAIFGGLVAVVTAYFKVRKSGRDAERLKQMKIDLEVREYNDEIIDTARRARDNAGADGELLSDDGYRRD